MRWEGEVTEHARASPGLGAPGSAEEVGRHAWLHRVGTGAAQLPGLGETSPQNQSGNGEAANTEKLQSVNSHDQYCRNISYKSSSGQSGL